MNIWKVVALRVTAVALFSCTQAFAATATTSIAVSAVVANVCTITPAQNNVAVQCERPEGAPVVTRKLGVAVSDTTQTNAVAQGENKVMIVTVAY